MKAPAEAGLPLLLAVLDDLLGCHVVSESGYSTFALRVHEHELAEVLCRPGAPSRPASN
jgi:hypothetical protein